MVGETQGESHETQRGDRAARRRDVLAAAADVLKEQDWNDFSMREVARRVGVSPGAVYLWFSSKQEILSHLLADRLRRDASTIRGLPDDMAPLAFATELTGVLALMYAEIGRHPVELHVDDDAPGGARELRAALDETIATTRTKLTKVLATAGTDVPDLQARLVWLWAAAKGIGDQLVDRIHDIHGVSRDDFLVVAGARTAAGLLAADAVPS